MKPTFRYMTLAGILAILLCLATGLACAESADGGNRFPEGVVEVPMGTKVAIDDDASTVTISDCPVEIREGDSFVVYLQDLPIGYVANSVSANGDDLVVSAEKADKSVYELLDSEGDIVITPEMYEFVPAPNVTYEKGARGAASRGSGTGFNYEDGTLSMTAALGDATIEAALSDMVLSYAVSDGSISVSLKGNWGLKTELSSTDDSLEDLPLGEMRIAGVGKVDVSLSITQQLNLTCDLSGSFEVGIYATQDSVGTVNKRFSVGNRTIEGKGNLSAAMKITAGVDVLVAAADLYVNVGVETQVTTKSTYHPNTKETTLCEDYRVYVFSTAGAEAMYYSILEGGMKPIVSKQFNEGDAAAKPCVVGVHYENDVIVGGCTEGMQVPELSYGGFDASFSSSILSGNRERILETNILLPWDMTIDRDLTLSGGNLDLNGHTLTINGDLIQAGGILTIGTGTLNVHGDYRMQSGNGGSYGDSSGALNMSRNGTVNIDGDLIIQSSSASYLTMGTIRLKGNFYQKNAAGSHQSYNSETGHNLIMTEDNSHIIKFEDPESNGIGWLTLENDVDVQSGLRGGIIDMNAHQLTVGGTLYHAEGTITLGGGKLIVTGNYYNGGADSTFEAGNENITTSRAYLRMEDPADEMRVGGDFMLRSWGYSDNKFTAGTLYLAGDFRQLNSSCTNNFMAGAGHKTVLNGTGEQVISFEGEMSNFGTLEARNERLVFQNNVNWNELISPIHAVSNGANLVGGMNLNGHPMTIDGNVGINANVNMGGSELTVNGTLYHTGGIITLGGGKLTVTGTYYNGGADSSFEAGNENITTSRAYLRMEDPADEMRVGGDFMLRSFGYSDNKFTAGTLYLAGDFRQLNSSCINNFMAGPDHRTVLNGTGEQVISFEGAMSNFGTLEARNERLVFQNNVNWSILTSPIHAVSNGANLGGGMNLNGHPMTIDGNVGIYADVNMGGSELTVNGTLYHTGGIITLGGGKLTVTGNYYNGGADSSFEAGNENITTSRAYLRMEDPADEMRVGGDFMLRSWGYSDNKFTAGTLYLAGDFRQLNSSCINNFMAGAGHRTVLNGTGEQVISFEGGSSGFGTLEARNKRLVFQNNVNWNVLASPIYAVTNGVFLGGGMNLNGYPVTIDGDVTFFTDVNMGGSELTVNGTLYHGGGIITLGGGKLTVTGNYYNVGPDSSFEPGNENFTVSRSYLRMENPADEMRVGGDFILRSWGYYDNRFTAGTLYLAGDFRQMNSSCQNNFVAGPDHRTVLCGTGKQVICFEGGLSGFGTLELTRPMSHYTFEPKNPCWLTLIEMQMQMFALPADLTVIEEEAFAGNLMLQAVTATNKLTRIEARAFQGCTNLLEFALPASVTYIAADAFEGCPNLALRVANDYCEDYAKKHQLVYVREN